MTDQPRVTRRKRGRPTLYTPETIKTILDTIRIGGSDVDAYTRAGIDQNTFCRWMNEKKEFRENVTGARVEGKVARIDRINKAGKGGDWRADAWYLERRWPEEYAQQLIVKVTAEQAAILKELGYTPSQAWEEFFQELAKAKAETK